MSFSDTTKTKIWDANQKAGYMALQDMVWGGSYELKPYKGKYWMSYFGGNAAGYEAVWHTQAMTQVRHMNGKG